MRQALVTRLGRRRVRGDEVEQIQYSEQDRNPPHLLRYQLHAPTQHADLVMRRLK